MSAPAWFGILGLTAFDGTPDHIRSDHTFPGSFDAPPIVAWSRALPGPPVPSASHAEMGRPVMHGSWILVGAAGDEALFIIDRESGDVLRRLDAAGPVQAAPVVIGDRVVFSDTAGYTWCYALDGGDAYWKQFSGAPIVSTPTIDGERVYIVNVGNLVYALDLKSGELVWRHAQRLDPMRSADLELYGSPAPTIEDGILLTGFSDGTIVGLQQETGELLWQRRVGEGRYPDVIATPMVYDNHVVVGGFSKPLLAVDIETREVVWRLDIGSGQAPMVRGERMFHGGVDGVLRAIDVDSGSVRWSWDSETESALTQPVWTDAGLLVGASSGSLYLVDPDTGERTWRLESGVRLAGISVAPSVDGRQAVLVTNAGNLMSLVVPVSQPK